MPIARRIYEKFTSKVTSLAQTYHVSQPLSQTINDSSSSQHVDNVAFYEACHTLFSQMNDFCQELEKKINIARIKAKNDPKQDSHIAKGWNVDQVNSVSR